MPDMHEPHNPLDAPAEQSTVTQPERDDTSAGGDLLVLLLAAALLLLLTRL